MQTPDNTESLVGTVISRRSATNSEIKSILSNPESKAEFEQATGISLTGTAAENRKAVKSALESLPTDTHEDLSFTEEFEDNKKEFSASTVEEGTVAALDVPTVSAKVTSSNSPFYLSVTIYNLI